MTALIKKLVLAIVLCSVASSVHADVYDRSEVHAITMWWVIFNAPEYCYGNTDFVANCTSADVFGTAFLDSVANGAPDPTLIAPNMDAKIGVLYATGGITGGRGRIALTASLYKTEAGQSMQLPPGVDPMGFGVGYENDDAEIHLVVRDHGEPNPRDPLVQITNFLDPYCSDPNLGYLQGPNLCSDVQFAIYGPGETGSDMMHAFANPLPPVRGARAHLSRDGDVIRAVVRTRITNP